MRRARALVRIAACAPLLLGAVLAAPAHAQGSVAPCAAYGDVQDACQKATDVFALLAPQLGVVLAGGNAVIGQVGTIGGFGHLSASIRATGLRADLPDLDELSAVPGGARPSVIPTSPAWVALPVLDVDVGLLPGVPVGVTYVGAVDLLVTAAWLPELQSGNLSVKAAGGRYRAGYGARIELLRETSVVPAVALTGMHRSLPAADILARTGGRDSLEIRDVRASVDSWRLIAGKSFLNVAVAVGMGQDRHRASADMSARLGDDAGGARMAEPLPLRQRLERTNVFANVSLNLAPFRLTGEVGRSWGGDVGTLNSFEGTSVAAPRTYASVGLLVGF